MPGTNQPQRWDIYWANVAFSDDPSQWKKRPVLIIDNRDAYILSYSMTHVSRPSETEYRVIEWVKAGLSQPTTIRIGHFVDVTYSLVCYIGRLQKVDIDNVKKICAKYNISLTRKTEKMRLINKNKLEEAVNNIGIADNGVNNMDKGRIDLDTSLHGEAPYTYVDAIKDHDETIDKVEECTKDIVDYANEMIEENQREAHGKIKGSTELKKMKLAESLFEDYEPEQVALTENIDEVDDEVIVEDAEAGLNSPFMDIMQGFKEFADATGNNELRAKVDEKIKAVNSTQPEAKQLTEKKCPYDDLYDQVYCMLTKSGDANLDIGRKTPYSPDAVGVAYDDEHDGLSGITIKVKDPAKLDFAKNVAEKFGLDTSEKSVTVNKRVYDDDTEESKVTSAKLTELTIWVPDDEEVRMDLIEEVEAEPINEALEMIGYMKDFHPWGDAVPVFETIEAAGKLEAFEHLLEDYYNEAETNDEEKSLPTFEQINDLLIYRADWIYDMLQISPEQVEVEEDELDFEPDDEVDIDEI